MPMKTTRGSSSSDESVHAHFSSVVLRMRTLSPCAPRGRASRCAVAEDSQCGERGSELYLEREKNNQNVSVI